MLAGFLRYAAAMQLARATMGGGMRRVLLLSLLLHALAGAALLTVRRAAPSAPEEQARTEVIFGDAGAVARPPAPPPAPPAPPAPNANAAPPADLAALPPPRPQAATEPPKPVSAPPDVATEVRLDDGDAGFRLEHPDPSVIQAKDDPGNRPPQYPAESRQRHEQGTVVLRLHIDTAGAVAWVEKLQSSGHAGLDAAAEAAAARWRFLPATRDGEPIESYRDQPFKFIDED